MCESYLEEFEEALKMKMLLDATYLLKSTNDLLNFNINYHHLSYVDSEQIKTTTYEHFQHIANEYDFQFQIGFLEMNMVV
ncbi:hypothetical protein [Methanobacterium sp. SMA-27]|uniref:hypothetical protein n=1 Tax=Methanobacterium sp. SMA-27 TaxID=1495336 RepID=UPI00064EFBDE|nr:hypothetical protein [Methanobacterium sp. SMA-27]